MMADALLEQEMDELRKKGIITDEEESEALAMAAHELEKEVSGKVDEAEEAVEETTQTVEEAVQDDVAQAADEVESEADTQE